MAKTFSGLEDIFMGRSDDGPSLDAVAMAYQLIELIKQNPDRVALMDRTTGKIMDPSKL